MGGVSRSAGCASCKKSKVKCDEAKPICGRCKKTGRGCGYADRFKFVPETSKQRAYEASENTFPRSLVSSPPRRGIFLHTSEKRTEGGGLFQKWHRSFLCPSPTVSPSLSPAEIQAFDLAKCWDEGPLGMRFDLMVFWLKDIPSRLGVSLALDDTAHLLSAVHQRMINNSDSAHWICRIAYIKALRSLREALEDSEEGYAVETMAAAQLLYHIEDKFGNPFEWNTIHHAGGARRLLEARGPRKLRDELDWKIIYSVQGPILSQSIMLGQPSFLSDPKWAKYFSSFKPATEVGTLMQEVSLLLAYWPNLTAKVNKLRSGLLSATELEDTQTLLSKLKHRLAALDALTDEGLKKEENVAIVQSSQTNSPFDLVYDFRESMWFGLINLLCAYILVLDNFSAYIGDFVLFGASQIPLTDASSRITPYHRKIVEKACRSYEYTTLRRPLLSGTCQLSLTPAYCYADTDEIRNWILNSLNEGDDYRQLVNARYTPLTMEFLNKLFIGAVNIPLAPQYS